MNLYTMSKLGRINVFSVQLTESNIPLVTRELCSDEIIVRKWIELYDALKLPRAELYQIQKKWVEGTILIYEVIVNVLQMWVSKWGRRATVYNLLTTLKDLDLILVHEKVSKLLQELTNPSKPHKPVFFPFRQQVDTQIYGRERDLERISAALTDHKYCIIVGEIGSGKSSLINLYTETQIYKIKQNVVILDGQSIGHLTECVKTFLNTHNVEVYSKTAHDALVEIIFYLNSLGFDTLMCITNVRNNLSELLPNIVKLAYMHSTVSIIIECRCKEIFSFLKDHCNVVEVLNLKKSSSKEIVRQFFDKQFVTKNSKYVCNILCNNPLLIQTVCNADNFTLGMLQYNSGKLHFIMSLLRTCEKWRVTQKHIWAMINSKLAYTILRVLIICKYNCGYSLLKSILRELETNVHDDDINQAVKVLYEYSLINLKQTDTRIDSVCAKPYSKFFTVSRKLANDVKFATQVFISITPEKLKFEDARAVISIFKKLSSSRELLWKAANMSAKIAFKLINIGQIDDAKWIAEKYFYRFSTCNDHNPEFLLILGIVNCASGQHEAALNYLYPFIQQTLTGSQCHAMKFSYHTLLGVLHVGLCSIGILKPNPLCFEYVVRNTEPSTQTHLKAIIGLSEVFCLLGDLKRAAGCFDRLHAIRPILIEFGIDDEINLCRVSGLYHSKLGKNDEAEKYCVAAFKKSFIKYGHSEQTARLAIGMVEQFCLTNKTRQAEEFLESFLKHCEKNSKWKRNCNSCREMLISIKNRNVLMPIDYSRRHLCVRKGLFLLCITVLALALCVIFMRCFEI